MAEAQFIPGPGAGNIVGSLNAGINTGASLMARKQEMQLRERQAQLAEEEARRRQDQFEMLRPAMAAKATADIAEAGATVTGLEQAEKARTWANGILPQARSDFDDVMQMEDPDMRAAAALQWIGTYGQLESVASYSAEFKSKKDIAAKLHQEAVALRHLGVQIEGNKDIAKIRGDTAVEVAGTRAQAGDKIGRYRAALDEARASGDQEAIQLYSNLLQKAQASPINTAYGSEQMQQKLEAARASGDAEEVQFWEKRIRALTERGVRKGAGLSDARAGGIFDAPAAPAAGTPAASPAPSPKPAAAPVSDPLKGIKL